MAIQTVENPQTVFETMLGLSGEQAERVVNVALIRNRVGGNLLAGPAYLYIDSEQGLFAWKVPIYLQRNDQTKSIPTGDYIFVSKEGIIGDVGFSKIRETAKKTARAMYSDEEWAILTKEELHYERR